MKQNEVNNIRKAIDMAEKPGVCKYIVDGKPCCVIAQLGALEGISLEDIAKWDEYEFPGISYNENGISAKLHKYPVNLLNDLQLEWDGSTSYQSRKLAGLDNLLLLTEEELLDLEKHARIRMHELVSKELEKPEHHSFLAHRLTRLY